MNPMERMPSAPAVLSTAQYNGAVVRCTQGEDGVDVAGGAQRHRALVVQLEHSRRRRGHLSKVQYSMQ